VLDLFLGSGSTLIAAERTGRICLGVELDPLYCDVIVARWEAFTEQQAALAGSDPQRSSVRRTREARMRRLQTKAAAIRADTYALYLASCDSRVPWYAKAVAGEWSHMPSVRSTSSRTSSRCSATWMT
jgi:hypothetical protein